MSLERFRLELAIPTSVFNAIPTAKKIAFRDIVRELKSYAVNINAGLPNEEMTVLARRHTCHHDEPGNTEPCNLTEQDI